jgi:hypothetical protein
MMAGTSRARPRPAHELDAELTAATDAVILQSLSSVGCPRSGKNLSRHRFGAKGSTSTPCGGSYRSCFS